MTEVSQVFQPNGLRLDLSVESDNSDDEIRDDEIKKVLVEGMGDETFDYDSDNSLAMSQNSTSALLTELQNGNLDQSNNSSFSFSKVNGHGYNIGSKRNGYNNTNGLEKGDHNMNNVYTTVDDTNGNGYPVSFMHKQHCPQTEKNGGLGDIMLLESQDNLEQLKALCEFRERQVSRGEETIEALQKDKRALNHQIGMMKSEMIHMKGQTDEMEKMIAIKAEEMDYLNGKLKNAVSEYEASQIREKEANIENQKLRDEMEKLHQEIRLLSSIGSSAQQAEIDQVVRQIREKHAKEKGAWQKVVKDLESQVQALNDYIGELMNKTKKQTFSAEAQTSQDLMEDWVVAVLAGQKSEREEQDRQKEEALKETVPKSEVEKLIFETLESEKKQHEQQKNEIIKNYEMEIEEYRSKLKSLPSELYQRWKATQERFGLTATNNVPRPASVNKSTETTEFEINHAEQGTAMSPIRTSDKNESVQVNLLSSPVHSTPKNKDNTSARDSSSFLKINTSDEKSFSSVIIQTDQSLETFKNLDALIQSWALEVKDCNEKRTQAEDENKALNDKFIVLGSQYRELGRVLKNCRKQWKREKYILNKQFEQEKAKHLQLLELVQSKLSEAEMEVL